MAIELLGVHLCVRGKCVIFLYKGSQKGFHEDINLETIESTESEGVYVMNFRRSMEATG